MNRIAVIAEYNPFHNGHHYMLRTLRSRFGSSAPIVVVMSGSFVQRGEPALFDKWTRASWALDGGADCVIELPALYALSSACRRSASRSSGCSTPTDRRTMPGVMPASTSCASLS